MGTPLRTIPQQLSKKVAELRDVGISRNAADRAPTMAASRRLVRS